MVNIYKQELTLLEKSVLRVLFIHSGKGFNINQLAKILNVSQPGIMKSVKNLEKKDFIFRKKDKESSRWNVGLNLDNFKVKGLKRVDNLKQLYEIGFVEEIYSVFQEATVILFGSYSLGEDNYLSDIDIAVIGSKEKKINDKFEKILQKKINFQYFKSFKEIERFLLNNISKGIVLKGDIDL